MKRKGYAEEYLLWLLFFDLLAVAVGLGLAYILRFELQVVPTRGGWRHQDYLRIWPVAVACWGLAMAQVGAYRVGAPVFDADVLRRVLFGSLLAMALIIAWNFFVRSAEYSRFMAVLTFLVVAALLVFERWAFGRAMRGLARRQMDRVLILGSGQVARRLAHVIQTQPHHGMVLAGFLTDNVEEVGLEVDGVAEATFVAHIDDVSDAIRQTRAQQVIICQPRMTPDRIARLMVECERAIAECRLVPDLLGTIISETSVQTVAGIPLFALRRSPLEGWHVATKRMFDAAVSFLLLVAMSPFLLVVALLIKLDSTGPVLFKQQRMGLDGRRFNMYKFRSMVQDAEAEVGPVWTNENDDRRTALGAILRRTNIDELPQLFNVLRGDMSLVGPRPERPYFVKQFRDTVPNYMLRHRVKSGMTGWAQVNGLRGNSSIEERISFDLYYIENWNLWFDIKILMMTFGAWKNAY